jgi:hypothetical protein
VLQNLVAFQAGRLRRTYDDFVRSDRYARLAEFFFTDVYSPEDKTERDEQFKRLYESFRRKLGDRITRGVGELVKLNDLSRELDLELASKINGQRITDEVYEEAYRRCDNHPVRVRQIDMLCSSVRYFRGLAEYRSIWLVLKTVKAAAALFGGSAVISFLDRGYRAYRSIDAEEGEHFAASIEARERARLDRIYRRPGWEKSGHW